MNRLDVSELICNRDKIREVNKNGGNVNSTIELLTSYIKYDYKSYKPNMIGFSIDDSDSLSKNLSSNVSDVTKVYNLTNYLKKNSVTVSDNAHIENNKLYLTREFSEYDVMTAVNIVNKTHPIYDVWEECFMNTDIPFCCGNSIELFSDENIFKFINSIDFEFTTVQNVLLLMDLIYVDMRNSNIKPNLTLCVTKFENNIGVYNKDSCNLDLYPFDVFEQHYQYREFS